MNKTLDNIQELVNNADCILIGAGAGLSSSAGIDYAGEEFKKEFAPFIKKYGFTDLYTSGFYDFRSEEEYWAYWAKHIYFADTGREGTERQRSVQRHLKRRQHGVGTIRRPVFQSGRRVYGRRGESGNGRREGRVYASGPERPKNLKQTRHCELGTRPDQRLVGFRRSHGYAGRDWRRGNQDDAQRAEIWLGRGRIGPGRCRTRFGRADLRAEGVK